MSLLIEKYCLSVLEPKYTLWIWHKHIENGILKQWSNDNKGSTRVNSISGDLKMSLEEGETCPWWNVECRGPLPSAVVWSSVSSLIHSEVWDQMHHWQGPMQIEKVGPVFKKNEEFQEDNSRTFTRVWWVLCVSSYAGEETRKKLWLPAPWPEA